MNKTAQTLASPYSTNLPTGDLDDNRLVEQALLHPQAFSAIYDRYLRRVYRYFYTRMYNAADAEDLTAQVFLSALEHLRKYRPDESLAAWLFGIAHHKAADAYRKRIPEMPFEAVGAVASQEPSPLAQVIERESQAGLEQRLGRLKEEERELLRLRFAAQLGFAEIARVLGKKESAVKMALYRLLERLEGQLEEGTDER